MHLKFSLKHYRGEKHKHRQRGNERERVISQVFRRKHLLNYFQFCRKASINVIQIQNMLFDAFAANTEGIYRKRPKEKRWTAQNGRVDRVASIRFDIMNFLLSYMMKRIYHFNSRLKHAFSKIP